MRILPISVVIGVLTCASAFAQDAAELIKELKKDRDDAKPALIKRIAKIETREAMEGLVSAYDVMASIYMRREIVRALVKFDGVAEAQQPAAEKLTYIATHSDAPELRTEAIKSLSRSSTLGRHFLKQIVDSDADEDVRTKAMKAHIADATKDDANWYRYHWNPELERRKDDQGRVEGIELDIIRLLAFQGLATTLSDDELIGTVRNEEMIFKIRRAALTALAERRSPKTTETAKWVFERVSFPGAARADAARILAEVEGAKVVSTFLNLAKKKDVTQEDLRITMAEIIGELNDESANKKVVKTIGKGKPHQKVFAIMATQHLEDAKMLKKLRKGLRDRDISVRVATAQSLGKRRDADSLKDLEKMMKKPKTAEDLRVAIEAITMIKRTKPAWIATLVEMAAHEDRDVRNAALEQIGKTQDKNHLPTIYKALGHSDWSTRLVAIRAVEHMRRKVSIPELIGRLEHESGRMKRLVADCLWKLTGQPFDEDHKRWKTWWENEAKDFRIISESKLADAERARELRRLKQRTSTAKFFGIKILSHRVIFIIDTSGSMTDTVHGRYVGKRQMARIEVAKEELRQCIENLDESALFNILAFSSGIGYFIKEGGIATSSTKTKEDAYEFIDRLGAGGATNLYDTLKLAFEDPDVDTIFVMSDGEPTAGEVIDPHRIREQVKFWNKHRRIKVNTIAIGGDLEVLEWLAEDSGGSHVRIR